MFVHPAKMLVPMDVTLEGMLNEESSVHPSKALLPRLVIFDGILNDDSDVPAKALAPIPVTLLGMLDMLVALQAAINVCETLSTIALLPSGLSYVVFPASTVTVEIFEQPAKMPEPMEVTLAGMFAVVRPVQPAYLQIVLYQ